MIQGDAALAKDVKLIGIAVGNSKKQADAYKAQFRTTFPVFPDDKGDIFLTLGKPSTPTMLVTTPGGKVLMSHGGMIEDFDGVVNQVRELQKKQ